MSGHDMSGMDMDMSMSMGTFHWSSSGDAFWLDSFVPKTEGAYIGACIGLFVFTIVTRALLALEVYFIAWREGKLTTDAHAVATNIMVKDEGPSSDHSSEALTYPVQRNVPAVPPFSWINDPARSLLTTLSSFLSYLLMMVVMTGNGGYFIVVIAGIFVGEVAFGRYRSIGGPAAGSGHHDH
ncbi:Ctr copper transporter [Gongronella butleri]|nr:Ctr copper transporter [Gongronella butleri]